MARHPAGRKVVAALGMAKQQAMRQEIGDASNRPRETFQPEQERMSLPGRAGYRFEEACCDMGVLRRERRQDRVGVIDHDSAAPGNGDTVQDVPGSLEIIGKLPRLRTGWTATMITERQNNQNL